MADELLDIVDDHDCVIGQKYRSEIYQNKLSCFRVVNAFLVNDSGQIWIPRRTAQKRLFPLCLDASMGGHVAAGESYTDAFMRELMEELGLDAYKLSYECIGTLNPHEHKTSAFMKVYCIQTNDTPPYNTDDFTEYYWLTPQEVLKRIACGDNCKGDLPIMIKHLL